MADDGAYLAISEAAGVAAALSKTHLHIAILCDDIGSAGQVEKGMLSLNK